MLLGGLALLITLALAWFIAPLQPTLDYDTSTLAPAELFTLRTFSSSPYDLIVRPWREGPRHAQEGEENLGRVLIVLLALALIVRVRDRRRWFWLSAAIVTLVLSFGPDVDVFGTRVPLPFRLIHETFGGQMLTPIRFLAPAMVPLIVFLACSFDPWLRRVRSGAGRGALAGGVALLLLWDFGALKAFPHSPALPQYDFYTMIGREQYDDYDQVVLEVPAAPSTGWLLLGDHPEAMAYGTVHGKRMLSGLISRAPIEQHLYYQESPLIGWLSGVRPLDAGRAIGELRQIVDEWPVGYAVVHLDWLTFERQAEILALFNAHPSLCYLGAEGDALLYRTTSHPAGCPLRTPSEAGPGVYRIDIGARDAAIWGTAGSGLRTSAA